MSERAGVRSFTTICLPSRARVPPASPSANRPFLDDVKTLRQRTGDGDVLDSSRPSREDFTMISEWSARFSTPPSAISFPAKCVGRVCVSRMRCGCGARVSCVQRAYAAVGVGRCVCGRCACEYGGGRVRTADTDCPTDP